MIGKKFQFTGKVGVYDHKTEKICIEDVHSVEGFERDHVWVSYTKRLDFKQGTKISFTAILYEYLGVDNDYNQFKKIGLMTLRNVRRTL